MVRPWLAGRDCLAQKQLAPEENRETAQVLLSMLRKPLDQRAVQSSPTVGKKRSNPASRAQCRGYAAGDREDGGGPDHLSTDEPAAGSCGEWGGCSVPVDPTNEAGG